MQTIGRVGLPLCAAACVLSYGWLAVGVAFDPGQLRSFGFVLDVVLGLVVVYVFARTMWPYWRQGGLQREAYARLRSIAERHVRLGQSKLFERYGSEYYHAVDVSKARLGLGSTWVTVTQFRKEDLRDLGNVVHGYEERAHVVGVSYLLRPLQPVVIRTYQGETMRSGGEWEEEEKVGLAKKVRARHWAIRSQTAFPDSSELHALADELASADDVYELPGK